MEITVRDIEYFSKGIELLVHRCEKCVDIKGDCIEKYRSCFTLKKMVRPETFGPYHVCSAFMEKYMNPLSKTYEQNRKMLCGKQ
jgi:hypothetical protein